MDLKAQFHALDAVKKQEMLMPNLALTWGIPSIDGFGGGITPTVFYSQFMSRLLPDGAERPVDGRLGERMALPECRGACIPELRWLQKTDTRYLIVDKVHDIWHDDIAYDTALADFWQETERIPWSPEPFDQARVLHTQPLANRNDAIQLENGLLLTLTDRAGLVAPQTIILPDSAQGREEALRLIDDGGQIFIHGDADLDALTLDQPGQASIVEYADTRVVLQVEAPAPAYLILRDAFYPGWTASVNGESMPIQRANVIFRALRVPAGSSRVVFAFEPQLWRLALAVGLMLWVAALSLLVMFMRRGAGPRLLG